MQIREHDSREEARETMTRQLIDAIDQVRRDVAAVELRVYAFSGFVQPVPDYDPRKLTAWLMRSRPPH
jgi:hypothetical protein